MRRGERVRRLASRLGLAAGLLAGAGWCGAAVAGEPATGTVPPPAASANPFANPYMNPYLNPYMTTQPMAPQASLLYFMAAQRATGGIGSGRLSGSRPEAVPKGAEERRASPRGATRQEPAGAAAGYFHRGYSTTRAERPTTFGRHNRYFPDNRR